MTDYPGAIKAHKTWWLSGKRVYLGRRWIEQGFPWYGKFESVEEVKEYLDGDRIICLLCGRSLKALPAHLKFIHGTSADQYKQTYGIPWTWGLVCKGTHELQSEIAKNFTHTKPPVPGTYIPRKRRPLCEAVANELIETLDAIRPLRKPAQSKEAKAEKKRQYAIRNKEKTREYRESYQREYYIKNKARILKRTRARHKEVAMRERNEDHQNP